MKVRLYRFAMRMLGVTWQYGEGNILYMHLPRLMERALPHLRDAIRNEMPQYDVRFR